MQQRAQRAPPDHQPRDERAELLGREEVDLEHARVVRADRAVPELVDAEFGDCVGEGGVSERVGGNRELGGGGIGYIRGGCAPRARWRIGLGWGRIGGSRCARRSRLGVVVG